MKKTSIDAAVGRRITWVLLFFLLALMLLAGRLFVLQIVSHRDYLELASRQHRQLDDSNTERGAIYAQDKDKNLIPLALNKIQRTLAVSPKDTQNPEKTARLLAEILHLDEAGILRKLSKKDDPHEIIAKNIEAADAERIDALKLKGVFFEEERRRAYPHGTLAAHLLGFVSRDENTDTGKYGVERAYDEKLSGKKEFLADSEGTTNFLVALGKRIVYPPQSGDTLVLSVDYNIQLKAEEVLEKTKQKWQASSGTVLVLEPATGRVLALASHRAFDPNEFSKEKDFSIFLNPLLESSYELGSVVKPVIMAGGLEEKVVTPDTTYNDTGEVKIKGYTIRNFDLQAHHIQTMTQVLEKSLNTGIVFVSKLLGHDKQLEYLKKFGFGGKTGIDLPGEITGNISNLNANRDIDYATAAFGQGIAVTPLQLASAIGAIANHGVLMKPYIVDTITDDSGVITTNMPVERRRVISTTTAETLTRMLISVVRTGYESRAGVRGYFIAGKTGTAQIPQKNGRGYSDGLIHSFIGYGPAFNPKFLIYFQLNEPKGNRFAANTLTPAFHDLAEYILNYYQIPPDEPR